MRKLASQQPAHRLTSCRSAASIMPGMERPRPRSLVGAAEARRALRRHCLGAGGQLRGVRTAGVVGHRRDGGESRGDRRPGAATGDTAINRMQGDSCRGCRPGGPLAAPEAKADAWMLGVHFGSDTQSGAPSRDRTNAQSVSEVERLAGRLAVPTPGPFSARQIANAHDEFVSHVEADAGGTAHRLAVKYSPEACQLYKLGALWGYAMWIRVALPGTSIAMAVPINYYARQAGLPEPLTTTMITPASADGSRADRAAEAIALTEAVTKHLAGAP